jgi:molybdopterin molybdotransferase
MISPDEAWIRIDHQIEVLETVRPPRREALGGVLAESLVATGNVPAHDVSAMDGFALTGAPDPAVPLRIAGTIAAGDAPGASLDTDTVMRIMTGAPVPIGADRVIPVEMSTMTDAGVLFSSEGLSGDHIRLGGEIVETGQELLPAGSLLTPGSLSLLATHGYAEVAVHRRPSLAVLATGDEVVSPDRNPAPGQLRDSHTDFLLAAGRQLGLATRSLGIAADQTDSIRQKVELGLPDDVLLVCGGVSMGEFDLVEGVLAELGCRVLFDSVAIQPGKPLVAARHESGWVFGLPGNPASVMVGFWLFVRPLLRRLQGLADGFWNGALEGVLTAELPPAKGRDRFLSAQVLFAAGQPQVQPLWSKGSHDVAAFGRGTGLVRIPANSAASKPGDPCQFLPLIDWPTPWLDHPAG